LDRAQFSFALSATRFKLSDTRLQTRRIAFY
jgi:hypothetical protein